MRISKINKNSIIHYFEDQPVGDPAGFLCFNQFLRRHVMNKIKEQFQLMSVSFLIIVTFSTLTSILPQ